jgi:hypothetical protein
MNFFNGVFVMRLYHKMAAMAASVLLLASLVGAAMPAGYTGTPFTGDTLKGRPQQIPGIIQSTFFDEGGEGISFHYPGGFQGDCNIRQGHAGANVAMQVFAKQHDYVAGTVGGIDDSATGSCHLSWLMWASATARGEWENYTVHVKTAGKYTLEMHESVIDTNNLNFVTFSGIKTDSVKHMGISIRPPGDHEVYHDWKWDMTPELITLDTGLYVLTLEFGNGLGNFASMKFTLQSTAVGPFGFKAGLGNKGFDLIPIVNGNSLTVSYSLRQAGPATVSIYDCAGRLMVPAIIRNLNAGIQKEIIGLGNMSPGMHFVRVEQNGLREIKPFTITR